MAIKFYTVDVGQVLTFDILLDGVSANLLTTSAVVTLLVDGVNTSPGFPCVNHPTIQGRATYTVVAGNFPGDGKFSGQIRVVFTTTAQTLHSAPFDLIVKALFN